MMRPVHVSITNNGDDTLVVSKRVYVLPPFR
jgi:hypothetical protein